LPERVVVIVMNENNMTAETETYSFILPADPLIGAQPLPVQFSRVNVVLGTNGTGKSRVLRTLRDSGASFGGRTPVYIEGGRVINLPATLNFDHNTYNTFGTIGRALNTFRSRRLQALSSRTADAFYLLERKGAQSKILHSEAVTKWQGGDRSTPCPIVEKDALQALFDSFSSVFPEITLTIGNEDNRQIQCSKSGCAPYATSQLSDGERQVLFILADIAQSAEPRSLVVADEPELNLHPSLANRLWSNIERQLPESVFIYGTHSLSFAMRPAVDTILALKSNGRPALAIQSVHGLDRDEAREFLGAIPSILSANEALLVEGDDDSFDSAFYRWLLSDTRVAVVPIGGGSDVTAATRRSGVWEKLGSDVHIAGVIDRDYKHSDPQAKPPASCVVLEYHEAESYLCHPTILCQLGSALGTVEKAPTESEIKERIAVDLEEHLLRVVIARTTVRAQVRLNVALQSAEIRSAKSEAELRQALENAAVAETGKAGAHVGSEATLKIFDEEMAACRSALLNRDIEQMLVFVPGKELLARLAPKIGCKDASALARGIYKHIDPAAYPALVKLRSKLLAALGRVATEPKLSAP
jgi:energy-coupling factor transporter ATP-binding protein EcfA2